ncbi:DNA polymerase [Bienertia sinuspersici]
MVLLRHMNMPRLEDQEILSKVRRPHERMILQVRTDIEKKQKKKQNKMAPLSKNVEKKQNRMLTIIGFDHATRHLIKTLHNDPNTLSHLFDTDTVTIIAISSSTYWYVKIQLVINIVRCCSSQIPAYPWLGWPSLCKAANKAHSAQYQAKVMSKLKDLSKVGPDLEKQPNRLAQDFFSKLDCCFFTCFSRSSIPELSKEVVAFGEFNHFRDKPAQLLLSVCARGRKHKKELAFFKLRKGLSQAFSELYRVFSVASESREMAISKENYIVSYRSNMDDEMYQWEPPKNSAVHISAAVTANARIYMYPFISRDDCYYTDTDSVVLGSPLPEEGLSSIELGKFKLEDHIKEGIFYAPKSYWYCTEVDKEVLKFKGAAKSYVTKEWFQNKKEDPTYSKDFEVENLFTHDWANLRVTLQKKSYHLGKEQNNKRIHLRDGTTLPIHMKDISAIEDLSPKMSKSLIYNLRTLHEKIMKNEAIKKEEEQLEKQESEDTKHTLEDNSDPDP